MWLNCQGEEGRGVEVERTFRGRGAVGWPNLEKNSHGHPYSAPILVCTVTPWCSSLWQTASAVVATVSVLRKTCIASVREVLHWSRTLARKF